MKFILAALVTVFLTSFPVRTSAMTFEIITLPGNPGNTMLLAKGEIVPGDAERFRAAIRRHAPTAQILGLTSPGGNVGAALELADEIEARQFSVAGVKECASACAQILFPAGVYSMLTRGSLLGFHSCSVKDVSNELCNEKIAKIAVKRGFPHGTLMMFADGYGPNEMKWISEIGARCNAYYRGPGDPKPINGRAPCVEGTVYAMYRPAPMRPYGVNFYCVNNKTPVERLICRDKDLMESDRILRQVFDAAMSVADRKTGERLRREQTAWFAKRNAECAPLFPDEGGYMQTRPAALCLYKLNARRIFALIDEGLY